MNPIFRNSNWRSFLQHLTFLMLLWPGPIPIGHCHANAVHSSADVVHLSRHLVLFHPTSELSQTFDPGWHVHWVLPSAAYAGISAEELVLPDCGMIAEAASVERDSTSMPLTVDQSDPPGIRCQIIAAANGRALTFQQVGHLSSRQSQPELLGVMRC